MAAKPGKLYVGTSGWSYGHWADGVFYPKGLKQADWLKYYAERFGTVEVNMTFYRMPKPEMPTRWRKLTPPRFVFAIKLWRRVTHEKRLKTCEDALKRFFEIVAPLGPKRGPLLVQLPPTLRRNVDLLDSFLSGLKQSADQLRWRVAVEFRNREWLCQEVYHVLDRHRAALCLADLGSCPIAEPNHAPFLYVRRHGPAGPYWGCYTPEDIARDAARIRGWLGEGRDVFVYYNNDVEGYAVANARQLAEAIGAANPV